MLEFSYQGEAERYPVEFSQSGHIVTINGILPAKVKGFYLTRPGMYDKWDYTRFTTIYRQADDFVQFSDDGSVWEEPTQDVNISIAWNDEDDKEKFRPNKLTVELFADGEKIDQFILNATNNWTKIYKYYPVRTYSVDCPDVEQYEKNISGTTISFTHTVIPPYTPSVDEQLGELMAIVCDLDERVFELEQIIKNQ